MSRKRKLAVFNKVFFSLSRHSRAALVNSDQVIEGPGSLPCQARHTPQVLLLPPALAAFSQSLTAASGLTEAGAIGPSCKRACSHIEGFAYSKSV